MTKQTEGSQNHQERIQALIREMSLEEKMGLMIHRARGIPRLGIPDYNWWNEALHGVANNGESTVFPQAIALGATFDPDLVHRVATAISLEARAKFNAVGKNQADKYHRGLTFWAPNINIFRDPRWGRGQE
ncbi:MAG: glycoside hydrolase family 3 N-terminal domain-containing protein, partial [Breznakiellaceae bacterium]